jgi:alpha-glucosidase (family GH31 glycosyl hydrolase)
MCIDNDGHAFGVLIFNSNAQDYIFSQFNATQALLTYRTIGGILDLFFFAGPTPEEVIQQYQTVIGKPYMPPYWGLGFQVSCLSLWSELKRFTFLVLLQLCRYGYNTLANMMAAWNRTISNGIPLDVQWGDIDTFNNQTDFTYNTVGFAGFPQFVDHLHDIGMKFVTILDPTIDSQQQNYSAFILGEQQNIWIKWPIDQNLQLNETGNQNMLGYVWPPGKVVFPDFFYPPTKSWWLNQIVTWHNTLNFDAIWIDMVRLFFSLSSHFLRFCGPYTYRMNQRTSTQT